MNKSYTQIAIKNNFRVFLSDFTEVAQNIIKVQNTRQIPSIILASAVALFGPLLVVLNPKNDKTTTLIKTDTIDSLIIDSNSNQTIRAMFKYNEFASEIKDFSQINYLDLLQKSITKNGFIKIVSTKQEQNYGGQVDLQSGDLISDLAFYFYLSEQVHSVAKLYLKIDKSGNILQAQSVIFQLLPQHSENDIAWLETFLKENPFEILGLESFSSKLDIEVLDTKFWKYKCGCSREKTKNLLKVLGSEDIEKILQKQRKIELICQFCRRKFLFTKQDWELENSVQTISCVESFTGGGFAAKIVSTPGASKYFKGGLITYTNEIKQKLNIDTSNGVVNKKTALEMAKKGKKFFNTTFCVSFTGNAGPTAELGTKVGQVFIAINDKVWEQNFKGSRKQVIEKSIKFALSKLKKIVNFTL